RVIPTDRNQDVHTDVLEVLEHVPGNVVDRLVVAGQMRRQSSARQVARPHARCVEEGAARATRAVDDGFREQLHVLAVVAVRLAQILGEPGPAGSDTDDTVSVADRANRDRSDGRIQTGDVPAAGQNGYRAFLHVGFSFRDRANVWCTSLQLWPGVRRSCQGCTGSRESSPPGPGPARVAPEAVSPHPLAPVLPGLHRKP